MSESADGHGDRAPARSRRRPGAKALKPGSGEASPPPSTVVSKAGGRRALIEARRQAMAATDERRRAAGLPPLPERA